MLELKKFECFEEFKEWWKSQNPGDHYDQVEATNIYFNWEEYLEIAGVI